MTLNLSLRNYSSSFIAYFSMEVGLVSSMPTYSGGLGVLAGDTLKAAADLSIPLVGVTLLHRKGYFRQELDSLGNQTESPFDWDPREFLELLTPRVTVSIEGRPVTIQAWRFVIRSPSGHSVPVYFLDTQVQGNSEWDCSLTDHLYGGDEHYRLCQEAVLGIGGVAMLRALDYTEIRAFHMNEGHSALLSLALLKDQLGEREIGAATQKDIDRVRQTCVFTTHTPVPAGHDKFPLDLVEKVLGQGPARFLAGSLANVGGELNLTSLALMFSWYVNGVSHRHEKISQDMFPDYPINSITNGVHAVTWTSPPFQQLYDRHMEEWREDSLYLRYAINIPREEIMEAHREAKQSLLEEVLRRSGQKLENDVFTIGFARRATPYKRADLLFADLERLRALARQAGRFQVIFAGKAHPRDEGGKELIRRIFRAAEALKPEIPVVYLPAYKMSLGLSLCSGVDLWLNTPMKPREASGTSGMKAALNGTPSLSVPDGWWLEGHVEGVTGWSIEDGRENSELEGAAEAESLYQKLGSVILPMYYRDPMDYAGIMRSAIALNGSFFTAQRMMVQYLNNAYRPANNRIP
jgi:starch phosphorylase